MKEGGDISQKLFERIDAYLLGKMPADEEQQFKMELANNKELQTELDIQKKVILAVEAGSMKQQLTEIHHRKFRNSSRIKWYLAAASVIIFVSFGLWMFLIPDQNEKLFAENYIPDPGLPVPMSATDDYDFYDAMVDYKSADYDKAIGKWELIQIEYPDKDTLNYYLASSYFNLQQYEQAFSFYKKVIDIENSVYQGKSEWYMALGFVKTGRIEDLEKLTNESRSDYSADIMNLFEKLE